MVDKIILHHAGGRKSNPLASSTDIGITDINDAHKARWPDFPSELNPNSFIGYNIVVFPHSWVQTRYIGEETAATVKHNTDAVHILLVGNFTNTPKGPVDVPTAFQINTVEEICLALIEKQPERLGLKVKPGTVLSLQLKYITPHRAWWPTSCYGSFISDDFFRKRVGDKIQQKIGLYEKLLNLYQELVLLLVKKGLGAPSQTPCWEEDNRE